MYTVILKNIDVYTKILLKNMNKYTKIYGSEVCIVGMQRNNFLLLI